MSVIAASPAPKIQPRVDVEAEAPEVPALASDSVEDEQTVRLDFVNYAVRSAYGSQFVELPYDAGFVGL